MSKKSEKSEKLLNIEGEDLHIFWMAWGISMKFSEKTIILYY